MALVLTREGQWAEWFPTTELACSYCREPFTASREMLGKVNFTFDYVIPDPLERGEYWYLHKQCSRIEGVLQVVWGWFPMASVLGLGMVTYKPRKSHIQRTLKQRMPAASYEALYHAWRPAFERPKHPQKPKPLNPAVSRDAKPSTRLLVPVVPRVIKAPAERKPSWQALRFQIMKRDGYRCLLCGVAAIDGPEVRLEVDHIIPRSRGGTNAPDNLWTLCQTCNRGKGVNDL